MRITRLELHGFKSFADRTLMHFGSGISCVVGPNGCGKSNVIDAMRWCIGEQSARSLRGGEMLDVIFAGSAERKPVGYAEVGITLSAEGAEPFPGEYARYTELQVARRLYRSGASEYLINQTRCRRKDIVDLFMDTGVGNNLYSFIEQGRIDKIVSASAEDRRSLVDEAAGITRYKKRRAEALLKLEATAGQLDRAADVADEMGRRLRTLERQVVKAAEFRRLRSLLRQSEIFLGLVKYADLAEVSEDLAARISGLGGSLVHGEARLEALTEDLSVRQGEVEVASASMEAARDALTEIDARRREIQATLGLHEQRVGELDGQLLAARGELEADETRVARAAETLTSSRTELASVEAALVVARQGLVEMESERGEVEARGEALRHTLRAAEEASQEANRQRTGVAGRVAALEARSQELPDRLAHVEERLASAREERVVVTKRVEVAASVLQERTQARAALDGRRASLVETLDGATRREMHARDAVRAAEIELDSAQRSLAEAVEASEATAGMAEEEIAAEVGKAQAIEDNRLRDAARADTEHLGEVGRAGRARLEDAERRSRAWVVAAVAEMDADLARWRRDAEATFEAEDARRLGAIDEADRQGAARVESAEVAGREALAREVKEARTRREQAEDKLAAARQSLSDVEARRALVERKRRELEGRAAALEEAERAAEARGEGARAIAEAFPDARRLADHIDIPESDRGWAVPWLATRLWLPLVTPDQAARAAEVGRRGGASVQVADGTPTFAALSSGLTLVDDLAAAWRHHRETGRAAVVRGTGDRIDADGVLHVGGAEQAQAGLARREELDRVRAELADKVKSLADLDRELTLARAAVEGASIGARKETERVDSVEHAARERLEGSLQAVRQQVESVVRGLRDARAAWREGARAALDEQLAGRLAERDEASAALRDEASAVLAELRQQVEAELETLRRAQAAAETERRQAAQERVDAAREAAVAAVRMRTADVRVRRERNREEVDRLTGAVESARARMSQATNRVTEARDALAALDRERGEQDVIVARVTAEQEAGLRQLELIEDRIRLRADEREGLAASIEDVSERLRASRQELAAAEQALGKAEAALAAARQTLASHDAALARVRAGRDAQAADVAGLTARQAGLHATAEAATRELASSDERRDAVRHRIAELERWLVEARQAVVGSSEALDALASDRQAAVDRQTATRTRFDAVRHARDEVAGQVRELESTVTAERQELLEAEQHQHQASMEATALRERIEERYQVDLPRALETLIAEHVLRLSPGEEARAGVEVAGKRVEPVGDLVISAPMLEDEEAVREHVALAEEHRVALQKVGDVNLTALQEYEELSQRFTELDAQRQDLDESVQSIRAAIAKMNKECRERFRETFDLVNEAFQAAYPDLVGGGEARLQLTDEEDLLETGVEILVRPPGKRMQHLGLLSGGEKAMTAIALLLALFKVKPSPFCVLDEVDAPLDEANGARFNDMLRQMSTMTQFIVVTHNRKTMECADTLYGITMPSPGCSALVSVRVD